MKTQSKKERQIAILKKSIKWWNWYRKISNISDIDLSYANLSNSDLSGSDLRYADLHDSDLRRVDLSGANLDYSCLTFACKTLSTVFDQKHIYQMLYHAAKPSQYYPEIMQDDDLKELLNSDLFKKVANKFHMAEECGKL